MIDNLPGFWRIAEKKMNPFAFMFCGIENNVNLKINIKPGV